MKLFQGRGQITVFEPAFDGQKFIGNVENFQLTEPKMTDLDKFLEILNNQKISNDWPQTKYIYSCDAEHQKIKLPEDSLIFYFTLEGQFNGIVNYKE